MEAGGLKSLLTLLKSSQDEIIHRVAAGAIANLAMNGKLPFLKHVICNCMTTLLLSSEVEDLNFFPLISANLLVS